MAQGDGGRAERLKAALRQNLQRRKAQARKRGADEAADGAPAPEPRDPPTPDRVSGPDSDKTP